jgi:Asp-tRNA(Asn)/Glu-tRNA(Gln) amidotransferase B subunit
LISSEESIGDVDSVIDEVLEKNKSTVDKMKKSGKDGPIMFLVG